MTTNLLFALGTLFSWAGWIAALRSLYLAFQWAFSPAGPDRSRLGRSMAISAAIGALALLTAFAIPMQSNAPATAFTVRVPLVWFVMPLMMWGAVACGAMVLTRLFQAWLSLGGEQRNPRLGAAAVWAVCGGLLLAWHLRTPGAKIEVITGGVPLSAAAAGGLALLAFCAIAAMAWSARMARTRGYAKAFTTHIALLVGSVIFALPFAWLVITSFKEDRDMVAQDGRIIWIPRVQETVPYMDPKDPMFETRYQNTRVEATVLERKGDLWQMEIVRPGVMRGLTFDANRADLKEIPKRIPLVSGKLNSVSFSGKVVEELADGRRRVEFTAPDELKGKQEVFLPGDVNPVRNVGLRVQNYSDALEFLPPETNRGLVYLRNTLFLVVMSVLGTLLSSSIVAYAFSRLRFPGRDALFGVLLSTMMLPAAVTLLPTFLIFRSLGWIDTLYPLWVPAFFASAFNVFLLRQFFMQIPMELEDASKIDGCGYLRTFWSVMLPQIKPALAVIAIWTFMGAWNNFMGPLIYVNSPENMPISYAVQLFQGERSGEPGLLMAFATMAMLPVLALFFFAQRYFIEGVTLSGLGGR
jgi:multiple sugar transport system permease protein